MEAVDMLRLMLVVELRPLAVGRFSRSTGWVRCDHHHFQKYHNDFDDHHEYIVMIDSILSSSWSLKPL